MGINSSEHHLVARHETETHFRFLKLITTVFFITKCGDIMADFEARIHCEVHGTHLDYRN